LGWPQALSRCALSRRDVNGQDARQGQSRRLSKTALKAPFSHLSATVSYARNAAGCASDDGVSHAASRNGDASRDEGGNSGGGGDDASRQADDGASGDDDHALPRK